MSSDLKKKKKNKMKLNQFNELLIKPGLQELNSQSFLIYSANDISS